MSESHCMVVCHGQTGRTAPVPEIDCNFIPEEHATEFNGAYYSLKIGNDLTIFLNPDGLAALGDKIAAANPRQVMNAIALATRVAEGYNPDA